jgi:nucleotide-binding universal stress UspA family protein
LQAREVGDFELDSLNAMAERQKAMASRILVPLDGSRLAEQALSYATMLGRELLSELVLFRAVFVPADDREVLVKAGIETEALLA